MQPTFQHRPPKVVVALCTSNRPAQLRQALKRIGEMDFAGDVAVLIIDNHPGRAGLAVAQELAVSYRYSLLAEFEPVQSIALARNHALRLALRQPSDYVAMIDDDEWPEPNWLSRLLSCQRETRADVVCGPVLPEFMARPPFWVVPSGVFERKAAVPKTSNVLFTTDILREHGDIWFDQSLGLCGGEDEEFIERLKEGGAKFVACNSAIVHEGVGQERLRLSYLFARSMRVGNVGILLRLRKGHASAAAGLTFALSKLAYAANHLFWTPFSAWRLAHAISDVGEAAGAILASCGFRYDFYGTAGRRLRKSS